MKAVFILVRPRNPLNIGACARAMGNFGFKELRLVQPYAPSWKEAVTAVHASHILKKAKVFDSLQKAISDCSTILATTSLDRRVAYRKVISLPQISKAAVKFTGKTAFVFGSEKTGLSSEDIALSNYILHIPTNPKIPSLNLAQALMLCCYEIAKSDFPSPAIKSEKIAKQSDYFIFEKEFQNFLKKVPRPPVLNDKNCMEYFNEIKAKSALTTREVYFLKSLLVRTLKKIK